MMSDPEWQGYLKPDFSARKICTFSVWIKEENSYWGCFDM